jgi:hypothetical protein
MNLEERMCLRKKWYSEKRLATVVAGKCLAERGVILMVYKCHFCRGYHLTRNLGEETSEGGSTAR